jgi:hypothetical protein
MAHREGTPYIQHELFNTFERSERWRLTFARITVELVWILFNIQEGASSLPKDGWRGLAIGRISNENDVRIA